MDYNVYFINELINDIIHPSIIFTVIHHGPRGSRSQYQLILGEKQGTEYRSPFITGLIQRPTTIHTYRQLRAANWPNSYVDEN